MFQFLKNDKSIKKDICLVFLIAASACLVMFLLSFISGCASQATTREDSTHYVAQSQDYPLIEPRSGYGYSQGIRYGWPYCVYPQYNRDAEYFGGGSYERKEGKYIESESWSWWQGSRERSNRAIITRQTKSYHYP